MKSTIWRWRYWFDRGAFVGAMLTAYNVVVAIIGIAPITRSELKWELFALGSVLSVATWSVLANANRRADEESEQAGDRHREDLRATEQIEKKLEGLTDVVERKLPEVQNQLVELKARLPATSPELIQLVQTSESTLADIQARLPMYRQAPPPTAFAMPRVSSSGAYQAPTSERNS